MSKSKPRASGNGLRIVQGIVAIAVFAFSGCQTMQRDILVSASDEAAFSSLTKLEETIIRLDGAGASREEIAEGRLQIAALEGNAAGPFYEALLAAWSGRLFLLEGRTPDAQRELRRSQSLSPHNIPSQTLAFRLERDIPARLALIDQSMAVESSRGELLIERGKALFDLNRFSESVAAFDAAFVLLAEKPFYEEAYKVFRNKAWELRNVQDAASRTVDIVRQTEITWKDLIEITQSETDLLRFLTAGRGWPLETLFSQLLDRDFIPRTQNTALLEWPSTKPSASDVVLRSGAAWFLWRLNAENRANRSLLTRYSSRFDNMPNARSPVPDTDIRSPFIDAILGCVESEFMSLPDGRNFMPNERVRGSDFLLMLKRLK
jgi:tetratricopeptide (TPR) repeat protein